MCGHCGDMKHNPFADKYKAKMAVTKGNHETKEAVKKMGKTDAIKRRMK